MAPERFFLKLDPPHGAMAGKPVRVTPIDKRNFNLFQPLHHHVTSGLVPEADVASPLRQMVGQGPSTKTLLGEVVDIGT